jgi:hypothetical protein
MCFTIPFSQYSLVFDGAMVLARVHFAHMNFARIPLARILVKSDTYPQCLLAR